MTDEIREKFRQLKLCGQRNAHSFSDKKSSDLAVINYMKYLLNSGELCDAKDICFALWNISDSYAMLRKSDELYKNHQKLADFISCSINDYKFYSVCDTTQRFTLILGGYGNYCHELYRDAVENTAVTDENYRIAYEAHRAFMGVHKQLNIPAEHLQYANIRFLDFLEMCRERDEYDFFKLIYDSCYMKAFVNVNIDIEKSCAVFYKYLNTKDDKNPYIIGEWEYFNYKRSQKNQAVVGITAAVNALIDAGEIRRAAELYNDAKQQGLPENVYVNNRIGVI